jgi:Na+/H+ antiporter NhaC
VVAILLTIITREVVAALFVGVVMGAFMYVPCLAAGAPFHDSHFLIAGVRLLTENYIIGQLHEAPSQNFNRIKVLVFTFLVAFTIGVIARNGGTAGMVKVVVGESTSPRRGALTAWLAGLVVFFDDYANCMIVGPTMRKVFDRLKLSRAKLAYIIDATASPDASLALIGTWIGAVLGYIQTGLDPIAKAGAPAFLLNADGNFMKPMQAFIYSLPYRFYPIFTIILVFLIALSGRDFGPMRKSENRALSRLDPDRPVDKGAAASADSARPTWWLGFFPVAVLVLVTIIVLFATGLATASGQDALARSELAWWEKGAAIVGSADSYISILYGSLLASIVAVVLTLFGRTCSLRDAMDAGLTSMGHTVAPLVILVLAWGLSQAEQDLMLGQVLTAKMQALHFPPQWLPLAIFMVAASVSFATGTSWGTMGILCPITIPMAANLAGGLEPAGALTLFYASVGSVLGGAIFGDHCSPLSSTTVLSSIGADCSVMEHFWTQMPYGVVTALVGMGFGEVLCSVYKQPWYYGLAGGSAMLLLIVYAFGRPAKPSFDLINA